MVIFHYLLNKETTFDKTSHSITIAIIKNSKIYWIYKIKAYKKFYICKQPEIPQLATCICGDYSYDKLCWHKASTSWLVEAVNMQVHCQIIYICSTSICILTLSIASLHAQYQPCMKAIKIKVEKVLAIRL